MSRLAIQLAIGLVALAIIFFLVRKAMSHSSLEKADADRKTAEKEEIRATSRQLEAFVGYYELGDMNVFFEAVRVEESDTSIADVYAALEKVGAAAIVPPLKRAADAYVQFHRKVDELDHEIEVETVREAEDERRLVARQSNIEIKELGISVYDLLHGFRAKNMEVFQ